MWHVVNFVCVSILMSYQMNLLLKLDTYITEGQISKEFLFISFGIRF